MASTIDDDNNDQLQPVRALVRPDPNAWRPILQASSQVVLYNPTSHALSVDLSAAKRPASRHSCPYCKQALPTDFGSGIDEEDQRDWDWDPTHQARAANYFHLLQLSNETTSRPGSPHGQASPSTSRSNGRSTFPTEAMAEGYFKAFFQEEYKLGMGANGTVFLCQHVLDGTPLGHFAVKKIAVGESHSYLLRILREVRLLEQMRHPNIVTYHHAWLETCQFSQFGPKVPTLHVLMQWAEGGSLDDFIDVRLGRPAKHIHVNPLARFSTRGPPLSSEPGTPTSITPPILARKLPVEEDDEPVISDTHSRSARIRAFRAFQRASPAEKERMRQQVTEGTGMSRSGPSWKAVHLLSAEEVESLFSDVVEGLAFLHEKSILHLDLKPGNVLLTWDEGKLIPRAMLSDFGTSRDMMNTARVRSGNTGTLEYSSPESLPSLETGMLRQVDSKSDMWSLGMILHKMLFFRLPYRYAANGDANGHPVSTTDETEKMDRLEKEVLSYPGFRSNPAMVTAFEARRLPRSFLILLESLLNIVPQSRPSVDRMSAVMKEGKFKLQEKLRRRRPDSSAWSMPFMPIVRRQTPLSSQLGSQGTPAIVTTETTTTGTESGVDVDPIPTILETAEEERERQVFRTEMMRERVKLLGPPEGLGANSVRRSMPEARWTTNLAKTFISMRMRMSRDVIIRLIKSCILVVKVLTISRTCMQESMMLTTFLLGLALIDMMSDGIWLSGVLVIMHVTLLGLA